VLNGSFIVDFSSLWTSGLKSANIMYCSVTVTVGVTGQSPIRSIVDVGMCNHKEEAVCSVTQIKINHVITLCWNKTTKHLNFF
jgi:hypothetical protein